MASVRRLGYDYMLASHVFPTNRSTAIRAFRSAAVGVHPEVIARHKRAEVRLHAVQYAARPGFHMRVFLNTPQPAIETPTRGNPNYVGLANMFTGVCVGGPGHCDVPAPRSNRFDFRPRQHKSPSGFHLDATAAVSALAAAGAKNFEVNLVALNVDGTPAEDALKLSAVSLDFFD
jgi:tyrosinase